MFFRSSALFCVSFFLFFFYFQAKERCIYLANPFLNEYPNPHHIPVPDKYIDWSTYFNKPTAESVARKVPGAAENQESLPPNRDRYFEDDFPWLADILKSGDDKLNELLKTVTASEVAGSDVSPAVFDYVNAELAKAYGMDRSTAYQEALSNTAYQRAIKDMKAAGLNPAVLFGSGRGSGASGVSYVSRSGSGSGSESDHLFDEGLYQALSLIGGLIGMKVIGGSNGFFIGSSATRAGMSLLDSISK